MPSQNVGVEPRNFGLCQVTLPADCALEGQYMDHDEDESPEPSIRDTKTKIESAMMEGSCECATLYIIMHVYEWNCLLVSSCLILTVLCR